MLNKNSDFNFFVGVDSDYLEKSAKKTRETGRYDKMEISGVASDSSQDSDNEYLEPSGFDLSRFMTLGWINYDHRLRDDPKFAIGEPVEAKVINNKFFIKAKLFKENEVARSLWDTMIMLKKSGSKRRVGFSIEGRAIERDLQNPKIVRKALITGVAATLNPVNSNTYADIVKGKYSKPLIEEYKFEEEEELNKSFTEANGGKTEYLVDITNHETGIRYTIDKNLSLKVEKAISTTTAGPIIKEDLERKLKVLPFGVVKKSLINVAKAKNKGKISKSLFEEIKKNKDIYKKYM